MNNNNNNNNVNNVSNSKKNHISNTMKTTISNLRSKLLQLKKAGVAAVKAGTEVEDMNFDEIALLKEISLDIVPLIVKIGGPEARNDIRECCARDVDIILAPMIESEYAFNNFISVFEKLKLKKMKYSINIETKTAVNNLDAILDLQNLDNIFYVTIGRTDLAGSYSLDVDDIAVYDTCKEIINKVASRKIKVSVGGKIRKNNFNNIITTLSPDFINTRNILISTSSMSSEYIIQDVLDFEIELYKIFIMLSDYKKELYDNRIKDNLNRKI